MKQLKGKFWPKVRVMIWEKAEQLFQEEQARTMDNDFKAITPERKELREHFKYFNSVSILSVN